MPFISEQVIPTICSPFTKVQGALCCCWLQVKLFIGRIIRAKSHMGIHSDAPYSLFFTSASPHPQHSLLLSASARPPSGVTPGSHRGHGKATLISNTFKQSTMKTVYK